MTETEFGKLVVAIKTYYPREKLFPNRQSVELWYRELSDLDYLTAETAIRKHVSTSVYPPTIAEIRKRRLTLCKVERLMIGQPDGQRYKRQSGNTDHTGRKKR